MTAREESSFLRPRGIGPDVSASDLPAVGFALRNFSGRTGVSRVVAELARRLPDHGFSARVVARKRMDDPADPLFFPSEAAAWVSFSSWTRAASFDFFARRSLSRMKARLVHGMGDLTRQDVLSVNNCDAAAAVHVPDGRRPSPGVNYIRRRQFSPVGSRRILVPSEMVRRDVAAHYGVPLEKMRRVIFGVDLNRFHPDRRAAARPALLRRAGWPEDALVVLSVLSGDPAKRNFSLLVRAVEDMSRRANAVLCAVGAIPVADDPALRRLRENGRFFFAPPTSAVEDFYAAADVFALPAHYEEFGLTALEALASGCPVVLSARCGAAEIVAKGYNGAIVEDLTTPSLWADSLLTFAASAPSRAAARRSAEPFTWNAYVEQIVRIYRELL